MVATKKKSLKTKVGLLATSMQALKYTGKYDGEREVKKLTAEEKTKTHDFLRVHGWKNLKMLPNNGWEIYLEALGLVDDIIEMLGHDGNKEKDKIWRATHWRVLLCTIFDWY